MSVTISTEDTANTEGGEVASAEDIKRTLQELQRKHTDTEQELAAERAARRTLETNLHGEQAARTTAESERDSHAARVTTEAEGRWTAEKAQVMTAIAAADKDLDAAEEEYARHSELGDWKEAAKVQRRSHTKAAELHSLKERSAWLDNNKDRIIPKVAPVTTRVEQTRPAAPVSEGPVHKYSEHVTGALVGGEEAFLDARPQFRTDTGYRKQLLAASGFAAEKYTRGSEPYLREIERILGEEPRQESTDRTPAPRQPPARSQSADLPASRRAGPGESPAGGRGEIHLTAEEVDIADAMFGDVNQEGFYIADRGKRLEHYHTMKLRKAGQ